MGRDKKPMLGSAIVLAVFLAPSAAVPAIQSLPSQRNTSNPKVIKDPAEYNAYTTALNTRDPMQKAAAMEAFVRNYPDSVVKIDALEHAMAAYQQSGNTPKVQETAERILGLQPYNLRALAIITFLDRSSSRTDKLGELCSNAQKGLQGVQRWQSPEELSESESGKLRRQMAAIFYGASGFCALQAKDYSTARDYYLKALQINPNDLQDVYQLAVADLEMNPMDVNGFWYLARSMNLAREQGNAAAGEGMESYGKAKYRNYHGDDNGWDQLVIEASKEAAPPDGLEARIKKAPTPAELAVKAAQEKDPANLSFSDWEFILQYRDASPANKDAADKVWQMIQDKQMGGKAKLTIPIKVISAGKNIIQAAVTDENQGLNKPDMQVVMQKPLAHPPGLGTVTSVIGIITSYTPQPFLFTMGNAELATAKPLKNTQLSEEDIEKLLQGGVSPKRATELVKQKGIDFTLDDSIEARLRKAGATDELLLAIATATKQR